MILKEGEVSKNHANKMKIQRRRKIGSGTQQQEQQE
jgi:hypothetical protein